MALIGSTVQISKSENCISLFNNGEKDIAGISLGYSDKNESNEESSENNVYNSREQSLEVVKSDHTLPHQSDALVSSNTENDATNNVDCSSVCEKQYEVNGELLEDKIDSKKNSNQMISENEQLSDIDDDDESSFVITRKRHQVTIMDSDSEHENIASSQQCSVLDDVSEYKSVDQDDIVKIQISENGSDNESEIFVNFNKTKRKRIVRTNSDSEEENEETSTECNDPINISEYKSSDLNIDTERLVKPKDNQKDILSSLCDPESSDENNSLEDGNEGDISETELDALQCNEIISKSRKINVKQKEDKVEKMTAKKALEQRKEILAESQRRVRESRVSLPYHKPKPKSLKEFLCNRPKLASPLADVSLGISLSVSMKMNTEQLKIITQKIKEREKEVEQFYKSDSETELGDDVMDMNSEEKTKEETESKDEIMNSEDSGADFHNNDEKMAEATSTIENPIDSITGHPAIENILEEAETKQLVENVPAEETQTINLEQEKKQESICTRMVSENENIEVASDAECDKFVKEKNSEHNKNVILLSDITVVPTESKKTVIYNLDAELLELASEAEKTGECSGDYEFNLDGIDEESDEDSEKKKITKKEDKIAVAEDGIMSMSKRKSVLLEKLGELKPRLSVGPNQVLDLEKGIALPDEISQLRERFIQHNLKPEKHSHKREMSILSITDGQIHKETLAFKIDDNEDEDMKPLEKPGVRLQRLREELQNQMAKRRSDLWKEKLIKKTNTKKLDTEDDDEKSETDTKDILDLEEEEDFTDPEEDEDLEEDYCDKPEKIKKESDFVDDEAEESEIEDNEDDDLPNENGDDEDYVKNGDDEENDLMQEENEESDVENYEEQSYNEEGTQTKKVLRRIIRPLDEDSEDENGADQQLALVAKDAGSDNLLSSVQKTNNKTETLSISSQKSEYQFVTPVTYITGLNNLNTSGLKFVAPEKAFEGNESPADSKLIHEVAKPIQSDSQNLEQNNLESDSLSTQDVMSICSGQFQESQNVVSSPEISTQQLRDVFTGSMKSSCDFNTQDMNDICSGTFTGVSQPTQTQNKEIVLDENDDHLISQLINEDELEKFKKKFESPGVNSSLPKKPTFEEADEVLGTGGVIDSDEEEEGLKVKNKKRKRLAFSDDEESSTSEILQEETIDLQDDEDLPSNVDYDSEENEVDIEEQNELPEEQKKEKLKASDFFENEAELSESEWGSEDEDERNLDDLEFEKGDEDKFDEDKLRTDIEKLQMKQMLDEDNREVKMLQELLLEDGELHGSGRQRQFRWKNIDAVGDDAEDKKEDDDDVYIDEDESEEQYRKDRHKREMLKLKQQTQDGESLIIESQSLSFTHKSLKIKSQNILSSQVPNTNKDCSLEVKQPFTLLNKRGSFLSRGEKILQKIAETSKVSFTSKNTNRIVFQTVDEDTRKRKSSSASVDDSTPVALKKLRLSGLTTGLTRNNSKAKSLFENILLD